VRLQYESTADSVRIVCEFDPLDIRTIDNGQAEAGIIGRARAEEFSMQLLDALVDDHGREQSDGTRCAWLEKRRGSHNS
jgi:hypothetical protein